MLMTSRYMLYIPYKFVRLAVKKKLKESLVLPTIYIISYHIILSYRIVSSYCLILELE